MTREEALKAWEQMYSEIDKDNWLFVGTINPQMVEWAVKVLKAEHLPFPEPDIIRCKECKHAHMTYDGLCKYCDAWKDDDGHFLELYLDGDYYCADGERKESE